jgi:hypothetical protein
MLRRLPQLHAMGIVAPWFRLSTGTVTELQIWGAHARFRRIFLSPLEVVSPIIKGYRVPPITARAIVENFRMKNLWKQGSNPRHQLYR